MESIDRVSFFNIGNASDGEGTDFFDFLKPGVAILFGEDNNFICFYEIGSANSKISKIEKIDAFDEWIPSVSNFLKKSYNLDYDILLQSLLKSADEEDEDGFSRKHETIYR